MSQLFRSLIATRTVRNDIHNTTRILHTKLQYRRC